MSTRQVASGSAETATAVSQATATVEEVKQTAQISQNGKKSVEESIEAMQRIRNRWHRLRRASPC